MPQAYAPVPSVDEATDSPLSVVIPLDSPRNPLTQHHTVNIPIPHIKVSTGTKSPTLYDDAYSSDEDNDYPPLSPAFEAPKFIKVVGVPKPSSSGDEPLDVDPLTGAPIKPTPASVVNPVDHESVLVDVLEGQNEDPFTLEPFETLIDMHMEKDKDFIIARVTTVDPNDENRLYYSYYAAHHINKVLFRTQPEEGLLHRMKAKNPLNNMTIVGDVHYYVISAATAKLESSSPNNTGRSSFDSLRSVRSFNSIRSVNSIRSMISIFSTASAGSTSSGRRNFDRFRRKPRAKSSSVNLHESESGKTGLGRFLSIGHHGVRKRTLHLIMRPDAVENVVEEVVPLTEDEGGKGKGINGKGVFTRSKLRPVSAEVSGRKRKDEQSVNGRARRNSMDDAYVADDNGDSIPAQARDRESAEIRSSLDGNGSGATPNCRVTTTTPKIHRRVRSISFATEHTQGDTRRMHKTNDSDDIPGLSGMEDAHNRQNRQHAAYSSSARRHQSPPPQRTRTRTPLLEQALSPMSPLSPEPVYYTAKYYASDDDFLMKASVRAYFKEHALETSDAVLFTIPSSRDENEVLEGTEAHPALMGFVYAVSEDDEESGWIGGASTSSRALKWLLLCYVGLGFLLIKFVVPDAYAYIMAFLLIFLLCLVMILCL